MKALFIGFSFSFAKHSSNGKYKMLMKNGRAENNVNSLGIKGKY